MNGVLHNQYLFYSSPVFPVGAFHLCNHNTKLVAVFCCFNVLGAVLRTFECLGVKLVAAVSEIIFFLVLRPLGEMLSGEGHHCLHPGNQFLGGFS